MKELKDYKKEQLLKSHEKTKKRAEKRRKKLGLSADRHKPKPKPKLSENKKEEYSLVKRIENGDKSAVSALRRLQRRRGK